LLHQPKNLLTSGVSLAVYAVWVDSDELRTDSYKKKTIIVAPRTRTVKHRR
jgi:hypothetical protein